MVRPRTSEQKFDAQGSTQLAACLLRLTQYIIPLSFACFSFQKPTTTPVMRSSRSTPVRVVYTLLRCSRVSLVYTIGKYGRVKIEI